MSQLTSRPGARSLYDDQLIAYEETHLDNGERQDEEDRQHERELDYRGSSLVAIGDRRRRRPPR